MNDSSGNPGAPSRASEADAVALARLSARVGLAPHYYDIWGNRHPTSPATASAILSAMGLDAAHPQASLEAVDEYTYSRALPPVVVYRTSWAPYEIMLFVSADMADRDHRWTLELADGTRVDAVVRPSALEQIGQITLKGRTRRSFRFVWHDRLPVGRHRFTLQSPEGEPLGETVLYITPDRCHDPLAPEGRAWGLSAQLYGVRSARNWGIGDFADLRALVEHAARLGADAVGLNPLHALFLDQPERSSPYSPSSRLAFNPLYLAIEELPEFAECEPVRRLCASEPFQTRLAVLRRAELVNYLGVGRVKREILEKLYTHYRARHAGRETPHEQAFRAWVKERGETMHGFALFHALQEHLRDVKIGVYGSAQWPEAYRDPRSGEVQRFARAATEEIDFHLWLQWHCDRQLGAAAQAARAAGMRVGLYLDLAVSVAPDGADAWAAGDAFARRISIGAPPDDFNPRGQDWGLPPWLPERLRATAYEPFLDTLAANMRHAGALRIDHVMSLVRLFWVPAGCVATEGAYVHYCLLELAPLVALASARHRTLVIGEDLGTVPDEVRDVLGPMGVLSYRLFVFQRNAHGFLPPRDYPAGALVAATTHDLPTLSGWWAGSDIALRERLKLFPSEKIRADQLAARPRERDELLAAIRGEGLMPASIQGDAKSVPAMTPELVEAIHAFLARTPSRLLMVQLEDVFGAVEQANLPGTTNEHPNWCRKLSVPVERWAEHEGLARLARRLAAEGRGSGPRRDSTAPG
jgi:(1->4)-alpha-D-glucan 1-alpha-D-glucosylmutase